MVIDPPDLRSESCSEPRAASGDAHRQLRAVDASLVRRWGAPGGKTTEGSIPPCGQQAIRGYVISDFDDLDRAGDWIRCHRGPECLSRAYMATVYRDYALAYGQIDARARAVCTSVLPSRPNSLTAVEPIRFRIYRMEAAGFYARDYRTTPCGLPHATHDLRMGQGEEPAWLEIQRQRDEERVEGALLPGGPATLGTLFLFLTAASCIKRFDLIDTVAWPTRHGRGLAA
jgi:hypothetical protein